MTTVSYRPNTAGAKKREKPFETRTLRIDLSVGYAVPTQEVKHDLVETADTK